MSLRVLECGPAVTVQDAGRFGYLSQGVASGGAADARALHEGAALLGQTTAHAALEMAGFGGRFAPDAPCRIALTGAPMRVDLDGAPLAWNAVHAAGAGQVLNIGATTAGVFGYLHIGGGFETPQVLGSRATHMAAGLGARVETGQVLPVGLDPQPQRLGLGLDVADRFQGGTLRYVDSPQTGLFDTSEQSRFQSTTFTRDARSNRQGVRLNMEGEGFASQSGLSILSEMITPGDIQMTGDGAPYILMADCQTIGGYPRIGTVLPCDLPIAAQAPTGAKLGFERVELDQAVAIQLVAEAATRKLASTAKPRIRDPHDIADLASYQLISGAILGADEKDTP